MDDRRDFYVYVHRDPMGRIFYVGRGTGKRAWSEDRHPIWHRFVTERLGGKYDVEIVASGLTEEDALEREDELINQYGSQLVNWINFGRDTDLAACEQYHTLRDANRCLVNETRALEDSDLEEAISRYRKALANLREYEKIVFEHGLIGDLLREEPKWGEPLILDRLTLCLAKLNRVGEAIAETEQYFRDFPGARSGSVGQAVLKRIERLKNGERVRVGRPSAIPGSDGMHNERPVDAQTPVGWETVFESGRRVIRLIRQGRELGKDRHYVDCYPEVDQLKRNGRLTEAAGLLEKMAVAIEREAERSEKGSGMAPACHWQLAVIYRKLGRYREECLILERYALHSHANAVRASEFAARLAMARKLAEKHGQ